MGEFAEISFIAPQANVLVVDDVNINLLVAQGLLEPYKMRIDLAMSGMEAIEAVKAVDYDLILMDHMMPDMSGTDAVLIIRQMESTYFKEIPIVALTASVEPNAKAMFMQNGFNDFLSKPIDIVEMNAVLEKWIPKHKQETAVDAETRHDIAGCIEISGLNTSNGIALAGGTLEAYMRILSVFYEDASRKIDEIKISLKAQNLPLFTIYVHALNSACANVGSDDVSNAAKILEMAGRRDDFDYVEKHAPEFIATLETLLININDAIATQSGEYIHAPVDIVLLKSVLMSLKQAMIKYDIAVINESAKRLHSFEKSVQTSVYIGKILRLKLMGDYDEAIVLIDEMITSC